MKIIDFLPDPTFIIDTEGRVIAWNRAMEEITGVPASAILGKGDYEYAVPFYGERQPMLADLILIPGDEVERRYDSVTRFGSTLVVDIFLPNFGPEGTYFWAKASPLYDDARKLSGAIETIRDISDRKRAEQKMVQAQTRLAGIIDFLPDATFVIDTEGQVIAWNRAMEEITGIPASAILGKGDYEYAIPFYGKRQPMLANLILMPSDEVDRRYRTVQRTGDTLVVDIFIPTYRPGGAYFWAKASPLYDPQGKVNGAIETIRDITDRILAEERLARSKAELQIAAEIQHSFLPETIPQIRGFDIAARCVMAKEVGGDFFDVLPFEIIPTEKNTLGLMIADVSGKGIPAALFMALSRIVVRVNAFWHRDPAEIIRQANTIIAKDSVAGMFVTLFYGSLSEEERTLTYVNAGHNPPLLFRSHDRSIERLMPTGILLGAMEDQEFEKKTVRIEPGDLAVFYTDGITESINASTEMFGEERLKEVVKAYADLPAKGLIEKIISELTAFTGDQPPFDDMTLMVVKGVE